MLSKPLSWTNYPDIKLLGLLGPHKTQMTFPSQQKLNDYKKAEKVKFQKEMINTREDWQKSMRLANLHPFRKFQPLLNSDKRPILTLTDFAKTMKDGLDSATGNIHQ